MSSRCRARKASTKTRSTGRPRSSPQVGVSGSTRAGDGPGEERQPEGEVFGSSQPLVEAADGEEGAAAEEARHVRRLVAQQRVEGERRRRPLVLRGTEAAQAGGDEAQVLASV